jgi:hypothetical protein
MRNPSGVGEHGEQIDDVLLGLFVDIEMLMLAGGVKRVTKKFPQRTDRYHRPRRRRLHDWRSRKLTDTILSTGARPNEGYKVRTSVRKCLSFRRFANQQSPR